MNGSPMVGIVPWPQENIDLYREAGLWQDRNLFTLLSDSARRFPDKCAVVDSGDDTRLSFREMHEAAVAGALRLHEAGLRRGDRVLVALPNSWKLIALLFSCFRIGVIPVLALVGHRRFELSHLGNHAGVKALFTVDNWRDFDHQSMAVELLVEIESLEKIFISGQPGLGMRSLDDLFKPLELGKRDHDTLEGTYFEGLDPALFLLSGGTTGLPKLICRTHNDYGYNIEASIDASKLTHNDVQLAVLPIAHNFPLACPGILGAVSVGATTVVAPSPNPSKVFDWIEKERVTFSAVVPAIAQRWITHEIENQTGSLRTMRVLQVGGARMPDEVAPRVPEVLGPALQQVYGMAEGLINMTRLDDPYDVIMTTQGRPISEFDEIRVIDPNGRDVPSGERGLLLTRGPYTPRGYFNAPEANRSSFIDGWYSPGDVVIRRADGNLSVQGRDKDVINRGGESIFAEDIESILYQLEGVDQLAVVAMPDPILGERVCLYATLADGHTLTLDDVRNHLVTVGLSDHSIPERVEIVDKIPMTKMRKIDKKALRDHIARKLAGEIASGSAS